MAANSPEPGKPRLSRSRTLLLALCCLSAATGWTGCGNQRAQPNLTRGAMAPDFTLKDISGNDYTLSSYRGKSFVLLHIGTTWCAPCKWQVPDLEKLDSQHGDKLVVLSIYTQEDQRIVAASVKNEPVTYPALPDPDGSVSNSYRITAFPTNFLIDLEGRLVGSPVHYVPEAAITKLLTADTAA